MPAALPLSSHSMRPAAARPHGIQPRLRAATMRRGPLPGRRRPSPTASRDANPGSDPRPRPRPPSPALNSSQAWAKGVTTGMSAARLRRTPEVTWADSRSLYGTAQLLPQTSSATPCATSAATSSATWSRYGLRSSDRHAGACQHVRGCGCLHNLVVLGVATEVRHAPEHLERCDQLRVGHFSELPGRPVIR